MGGAVERVWDGGRAKEIRTLLAVLYVGLGYPSASTHARLQRHTRFSQLGQGGAPTPSLCGQRETAKMYYVLQVRRRKRGAAGMCETKL